MVNHEFHRVYICKNHFSKSLYHLFQKDREEYFNIDVSYHHSCFLEPKYKNFGYLYFESCNKSSQLFIFFCQVMVGIFMNKFRTLDNSILDHIFDTIVTAGLLVLV